MQADWFLTVNYYKRYSGDYLRDTAHLTMIEHGAYTLLLDSYYATGQPLPADRQILYRICRAFTRPERLAVDSVVTQFLYEEGGYLHNKRADQEIAEDQPRINAARVNGKKGGRRKNETQREPSGSSTDNPTLTHAASSPAPAFPLSKDKGLSAPSTDPIFGDGLSFLTGKGCAERGARSFLALMRKKHGDVAVVQALEKTEREDVSEPIPWLSAVLEGKLRPRRVAI